MFYGYTETTFSFIVHDAIQSQCALRCSAHGSCIQDTTCRCRNDFNGKNCEQMTRSLFNAETVTGYVSDNEWNYYSFRGNTISNVDIKLTQLTDGDCDIYVKNGSNPTRFNYVYRDLSLNSTVTLTIPNAGNVDWKIGIYGFSECSYNITVFESNTCPNSCSGHGICESNGACWCNDDYAGVDCSIRGISLRNSEQVQGTVSTNQWIYYILDVTNSSAFSVVMKETRTTGEIFLFGDLGTFPDLSVYYYVDTHTNHNIHRISSKSTWGTFWGELYIGVYGSAFLLENSGFSLVAYMTPF